MTKPSDLPAVILAGGRGTRLSEETSIIPKPMLEVGGKPLLQHIIDIYRAQGVWDFIVPVGYKKEQVLGYFLTQTTQYHPVYADGVEFQFGRDGYRVRVMDTGLDTQTGGRLLRIASLLQGNDNFFFTYGDGLADVDLEKLLDCHIKDMLVTLTAVHPEGRFGRIKWSHVSDQTVHGFGEKIESESDWINGGFAILSSRIMLGVSGDQCNLEKDVYPVVAHHGLMNACRHEGFWKCVDTLRDLEELRNLYPPSGNPPWLKLS